MLKEGHVAVKARISGQVQGVWYRGWTEEKANELSLYGWVRNRKDGTVEALFCGPEGNVETMLEHCKNGPPAARVEHIEIETAQGLAPKRFEVKPTV